MKILFLNILVINMLFTYGQTPNNDPHWQLVFQDEFNFLNLNYWEIHNNRDRWAVNSAQNLRKSLVYTNNSSNVRTENGNLVVQLNKEIYTCPSNALNFQGCSNQQQTGQSYNYTSGWVTSNQLFLYGYIEARIKVDDNINTHPAFWTFSGTGFPYNEIDIFEMLPGSTIGNCLNYDYSCVHNKNLMTTNVHLAAPGVVNNGRFSISPINDYTQWHTYAIEWSPTKIIFYVDNQIIRIVNDHGIIHPQSIYFNMSLDDVSLLPSVLLNMTPSKMLIDYVRVYEKKKDCNSLINECVYNFLTHDNQVKNSITIGGNGCNNIVSNGTNTTLRASEYIAFEGDLTIPLGTEFYADANGECSNWVNVYCSQIFNPCWYNFLNYDNQTKKVIELGGNSCSLNITSSSNLQLKATDIIVLDKGVTITPQTSNSVILEINSCTP